MLETTSNRANLLVDPGLGVWHGEVAADLFLAGTVAGILILTGLWRLLRSREESSRALRVIPWLSPALITLCLLFLWLDLANRTNAFRFYLVLRPVTPMSWGAWIILAVYPVSALFAWTELPDASRERWRGRLGMLRGIAGWAEARARGLAVASVVVGLALGLYTGVVLSVFSARPLWNSPLLPLLFLASGLACASSCLLLARLSEGECRLCGKLNLVFLGAQTLLLGLWILGLLTGGESARVAGRLLIGGGWTAAFWSVPAALGLVAPIAGEWATIRRRGIPGRATAVFVLLGAFALRWIIVYAGQQAGWLATGS